jgi:hypothetical protein
MSGNLVLDNVEEHPKNSPLKNRRKIVRRPPSSMCSEPCINAPSRNSDEETPSTQASPNAPRDVEEDEWISSMVSKFNPMNIRESAMVIDEIIDPKRFDKLLSQFSKSMKASDLRVLTHLRKHAKSVAGVGEVFSASYVYPNKVRNYEDTLVCGRLTPKNGYGLQGISRDSRNFLAVETYHDFDMVNCQPVLVREVFRKLGLKRNEIEKLIENREKIFAILKDSDDLEDFRTSCSIETGDRDEVKKFVLSLLFDYIRASRRAKLKALESINKYVAEYVNFKELADELEEGATVICEHPRLKKLSEQLAERREKKYDNALGTAFAFFLQQVELCLSLNARKVLQNSYKMRVGTHIHDGFYAGDASKSIPKEVFRALTRSGEEEFGLRVDWISKPMSSKFFDKDGKYIDENATIETDDYKIFKEQVEEFESKYFYENKTGRFYTFSKKMRTTRSADHGSAYKVLFSELELVDDVSRLMRTTNLGVFKGQRFDFKKWPGFIRGEGEFEGHNVINVFRGFEYPDTPENPYDEARDKPIIQPMLDLLREVVGGDGDPDAAVNYVLTYFAHILQKPAIKSKVAIIIKGTFGDGKDTVIDDGIGSIIGRSYLLSNNPGEDILGKFNPLLSGMLLVKAEELSFGDMKTVYEKFKSEVTAPTIVVQGKCENHRVEESFHNYIFTTNNDVPLVIMDGDRRFVMFRTTHQQRNADFWGPLKTHFAKPEFKRAYARFLWNYKIPDGWNAWKERPITQSYKDVITANAPNHAKFLCEFISRDQTLVDPEDSFGPDSKWDREKSVLKLRFMDFLKLMRNRVRHGHDMTASSLYGILKNYYSMPDRPVKLSERKEGGFAICHFKSDGASYIQLDFKLLTDLLKAKGAWCPIL